MLPKTINAIRFFLHLVKKLDFLTELNRNKKNILRRFGELIKPLRSNNYKHVNFTFSNHISLCSFYLVIIVFQ